jgi:hypothetical protein
VLLFSDNTTAAPFGVAVRDVMSLTLPTKSPARGDKADGAVWTGSASGISPPEYDI